MKTNTPRIELFRSTIHAGLLTGIACLTGLTACSFHPQIHRAAVPSSAPGTGEYIRKAEATRAIFGGALAPEDIHLPEDHITRVFAPHDSNTVTIAFFTDTGLVDRTVSLGEGLERFLDKNQLRPIENVRRGCAQDFTDACYLACVLKAFRMAAERSYISAVVHGGDAVQIGVAPEFQTYMEITGKFLVSGTADGWEKQWTGTWWETPLAGCPTNPATFHQVLGNHEIMFLGSFNRGGLLRVPRDGVHDASGFARMLSSLPPWREHRTNAALNRVLGEGTCRRGYYRAYRELPDGKRALMVMLNTCQGAMGELDTSRTKDVSFYPSIGFDQLEWLVTTLKSAEADPSVAVVLLFGHHPLAEVTICRGLGRTDRRSSFGELSQWLTEFSKVKAYICGHNHMGCPPIVHSGRYEFTEYVVPSLMEFPKSFALISLTAQQPNGEYQVSLSHHNLAELVDFERAPEIKLSPRRARGPQQWLAGFVSALDRGTSSRHERLLAAARLCYQDAARDVANHSERDFPNCFDPNTAPQLVKIYAGSQPLWEMLKGAGAHISGGDINADWPRIAAALQGPEVLAAHAPSLAGAPKTFSAAGPRDVN